MFLNYNLLKPDGWLVMEHSKAHDFSHIRSFYQHRKYGKVNFTFLVNMTEENQEENVEEN